jgi:predicted amidophosphoribosyltransferase
MFIPAQDGKDDQPMEAMAEAMEQPSIPRMRGLLDLLLPSVCPLCTVASGPGLCVSCLAAIPSLTAPCPWCAIPRHGDGPCPGCDEKGLPQVATVTAGGIYADQLATLIGHAKAGARPAAIQACAGLLPAFHVLPPAAMPQAVVPVPPSPGRRPGPHLGTALAQAVARRLGIPCYRALRATRRNLPQHSLGSEARRNNVAGLFLARGAIPQTVLLVDDLLTSGATASAAAAALHAAGARTVHLLVLARTLSWS